MKKTRKLFGILLSLVMILTALPLTAIPSFAEVTSGTTGDCTWSLDGTILTISGSGNMGNYYNSSLPWGTSITKAIIENGVTSIGPWAFMDCTSLESITIPDSVTSIGGSAFEDTAYYNNEANWENDVLYIGNHLIEAKNTVSGDYTVKDGTRTIADGAFFVTSLESITIPDSVTSIGALAFDSCTSLESITIPDSVTSIGWDAFYNTAYYNNESNWENDVLYIGNHLIAAKYTVSGAYTVKDGTRTIADNAFSYCTSLTSINVSADNANYTSVDGVLFNKDKTELICYPAGKEATTFAIPDSVTSIGGWAFEQCTSLASVTIPDGLTSIGNGAFEFCTSLASVTIPDSVTSIGAEAFSYCTSLTSVTIPDSITSIGDSVFEWCQSLESITIPDSVTSIGDWAFHYCASLKSVTIPDSVTSIGALAFYSCTSLKSVTIPDSVTSIGDGAFFNCESLTSITIPDSVTNIGDEAFGYYYEQDYGFKFEEFTIYGYPGSEAERYANENEFEFVALEKPEPAPSEASGDVNGDEKLSTVDAKWILQNLASTREFTDEQKAFADVNGDGKLSVVDAKWILQALAGLRELG